MNARNVKMAALMVVLILAGAAGGFWFAQRQAHPILDSAAQAGNDKKALYWYDPMVPAQRFDKPGKSPFMDMQLVPMYADEGGDQAGVKIDPGVMQNLGIRLAKVEQTSLAATLDAVATVQFNDRDVAVIQARSGGFVERVYARAPGDVIGRGAPLVDLRVPEWFGAQSEFLALRGTGDETLTNAARERLRQLGMSADMIAKLEQGGRPQALVTIASPIGGVIQTLDIRAGMSVAAGAPLARINGLDTVWLEAAIPETQAGLVETGMLAQAQFAGYPGEKFAGKVIAVLPETNRESHTLRVRVELSNPHLRFKPGMFAQLRLQGARRENVLLIPAEAVIRSGARSLVITALEGGRFQPVEVETGREVDGKTVILKGLSAGQQVVASGQFLIDSEASLKGVIARMNRGTPEASADQVDALMQSGKMDKTGAAP